MELCPLPTLFVSLAQLTTSNAHNFCAAKRHPLIQGPAVALTLSPNISHAPSAQSGMMNNYTLSSAAGL
jgi:hypothetical protein